MGARIYIYYHHHHQIWSALNPSPFFFFFFFCFIGSLDMRNEIKLTDDDDVFLFFFCKDFIITPVFYEVFFGSWPLGGCIYKRIKNKNKKKNMKKRKELKKYFRVCP